MGRRITVLMYGTSSRQQQQQVTTTPASTLTQLRQPGAESNKKPLAQIERLKEHALHAVNRLR